jgi:hypothetical protein
LLLWLLGFLAGTPFAVGLPVARPFVGAPVATGCRIGLDGRDRVGDAVPGTVHGFSAPGLFDGVVCDAFGPRKLRP